MLRLILAIGILLGSVSAAFAQQKYIAYASGQNAGTSSTRYLIAEVSVMPPVSPGNAANLVFRGLGGTPFPQNADFALCIVDGVPACAHFGFQPDSAWTTSFDVSAQGLEALRQNKDKVTVYVPNSVGFPSGEVLGTFHLANGTYND